MTASQSTTSITGRTPKGKAVEFHFLGFGAAAVRRFAAHIEQMYAPDGPRRITELQDAILTPMAPLADGTFSGGVFGPDGAPCPEALVRRKGEGVVFGRLDAPAPAAPAAERIEAAVYGGAVFSGYGHLILESIARLTAEIRDSGLPILFHHNPSRSNGLDSLLGVLEAFGVQRGRVRLIDRVLAVDRLIAPEPGLVVGESIRNDHLAFIRQTIRRSIRTAGDPTREARPIFLSRSQLSGRQRLGFGEAAIERGLEPFMPIAHLQTLPFAEQVAWVNAGPRLCGFLGSQMHNLVFRALREPLDVVYLCPDKVDPAFFQIDLLSPGRRWYVHAAHYGKVGAFGNRAPFLVRFDRVAQGLAAAGFIAPGLDLAPPRDEIQALERDFYVAWFENSLYFKFIRPSFYWPPAERTERVQAAAEGFRALLAAVLKDAHLTDLARGTFAAQLKAHAKVLDAASAEAFLAAVFS